MSQCQNVLCGLVQGHEGSHLCKRHCRKIWQDARSGRLYCGRGCGEVEDESLGVLEALSKRVEKLSAQQDDQVVELRAANRAVDDLIRDLHKKNDKRFKELLDRTAKHRSHLHEINTWRASMDTKLAMLAIPLGETVRKIIAQRLALLAQRIWADIPF